MNLKRIFSLLFFTIVPCTIFSGICQLMKELYNDNIKKFGRLYIIATTQENCQNEVPKVLALSTAKHYLAIIIL